MGCTTSSPAANVPTAPSPSPAPAATPPFNSPSSPLPRPTILTQPQDASVAACQGEQKPKQASLTAVVGQPTISFNDSPEVRESTTTESVTLKVMTYNLFWWNLYGQRNGNDASASKLIVAARPDIIGFQETDDVFRVLNEGGLSDTYSAIQGARATAVAFQTAKWELLAHGWKDVAEDQAVQYYGLRLASWARLQHVATGRVAFFVNHHGPLTVNSGGKWGGEATANNIWNLIQENVQPGDAVVMVGDFNAQPGSQTIQVLESRIPRRYTGVSFGGVDHVFTASEVVGTQNLGSGGSDHDALMATVII